VTGLLVSPIAWTHHWVWAVPLLVWLATTAWRRRSAACALAAALAAVVFSSFTPLPWPGHPPGAGRMAASDLYVLFGLALLAAVAVALARGRSAGLAALAMAGPAALGPGDSARDKPAGQRRVRCRGAGLARSRGDSRVRCDARAHRGTWHS
jgi:hypothetical protein